jgi:hypothetical protein
VSYDLNQTPTDSKKCSKAQNEKDKEQACERFLPGAPAALVKNPNGNQYKQK